MWPSTRSPCRRPLLAVRFCFTRHRCDVLCAMLKNLEPYRQPTRQPSDANLRDTPRSSPFGRRYFCCKAASYGYDSRGPGQSEQRQPGSPLRSVGTAESDAVEFRHAVGLSNSSTVRLVVGPYRYPSDFVQTYLRAEATQDNAPARATGEQGGRSGRACSPDLPAAAN